MAPVADPSIGRCRCEHRGCMELALASIPDHERSHLEHQHPPRLRRAAVAAAALAWWPPTR